MITSSARSQPGLSGELLAKMYAVDTDSPTCSAKDGVVSGSPSISLPGPGPAMNLAWVYNSQWGRTGAFGQGWTHSFDIVLRKTKTVQWSSGMDYYWLILENLPSWNVTAFGCWVQGGAERWVMPKGEWNSIDYSSIGDMYVLTQKSGLEYRFEAHNDGATTPEDQKRYELSWSARPHCPRFRKAWILKRVQGPGGIGPWDKPRREGWEMRPRGRRLLDTTFP